MAAITLIIRRNSAEDLPLCAPISKPRLPTSSVRLIYSGGIFDWDRALLRLDELNAKAEDPNLWNKPSEAQKVMRERTQLDRKSTRLNSSHTDISRMPSSA